MADSSYIIDNKTVYVYRLPNQYTYANVGTYQVTVTAINPTSDGCSGVNQIDYDVEVFAKPNANFYWNHNGCLSDSVRFRDTTDALGRTISKWRWEFGDGIIDSLNHKPRFTFMISRQLQREMSVITDVGCLADTTISIAINPAPVAKFGASVPQCVGVPVIFTDSSTIGSGTISKWYWDYGNGQRDTLSTNAPRTVTYATAGTYVATLTVEASGGCRSVVFNKNIVVGVSPVSSFQMPVICLPSGSGQFTSTSTISDNTQGQFTYVWNFGDGGTANTANPIHQFATAGPFNISLEVTSNSGCKNTSTQALTTLYAQPTALFNSPAEICLGDTAQFNDQSTATNSTIVKWYWDFGDGKTDTIQNPKHIYLASGTYNVKFVSRSAVGCASDTLIKPLIVNALPTANFTIVATACAGQPVTFTSTSVANSGNINRWQWDFGDGSPLLDVTNGSPVTHTYNTIQTYNATLKVTSDKGCRSTTVTKPVIIGLAPIAKFGLPQVCLNDPFAEFTDSSTIANGSSASLQYLWSFGDPNATPGNPNTSTIKNGRHRYTSTGIFNVTLIVTSASGCTDTLTRPVTINGGTPLADFTFQNSGNVCASDTVSIKNASTVNFGIITRLDIFWDYANNPGLVFTDNTPTANKVYTHSFANNTQPSRQYTVRMVAYSGGTCFHETSKTVVVHSNPVAGIRVNPLQVCLGDVINFEDSSSNAGFNITNWAWSFGDNSNGSNSNVAHTYGQAGAYNVRLQNRTTEGCLSAAATKTVTINPIPLVNAGPDLFILTGGQAVIKATSSAATATGYIWSPATWLNDSAILQPVTKPLTDITYTLTVTGSGNCTASDEVNVKVLKDLEVPNAFSPNGDGINDLWVIKSLESYPGTVIQIFDRYGRLVLTSSGYAKPWDGKINGTALPMGTYYYIIDPKNGRKAITGSVTILR